MKESGNVLLGILAVLLGLIVIVFPLISVFTINVVLGIGIIFWGIWFLLQSLKTGDLATEVVGLILGILAIILGIVFVKDIMLFKFVTFVALFVVAIFLVLGGLTLLIFGEGLKIKVIGVLGVIFSVPFVIVGWFLSNPLVLAAIIGAFLIIVGFMEIFNLFGEKEKITEI